MSTRTALLAAALVMLATPTWAASPRQLTGIITGFECGDNCYLTVKPARGKSVTALCVAKACDPWNEATAIPGRLIGARVTVTMGIGHQFDGSGNDMGEFPSFTTIKGLKN